MQLYNAIIARIPALLGSSVPKVYPYTPAACWPETPDFEMVLLRDAALELGGSGKPGVSLTCVTTSPRLVPKDEIWVVGPELAELADAAPYARIALIQTGDIESDQESDTEQAYHAISGIDFVKYHVYPRGYMMRASGESQREQARVSRAALREGLTFQTLGSTFIRRYRQDPNVLAVKLIFVTAPDADYTGLLKEARQVKSITLTLSKILEGLPTDCGSCNLKPICDEVEGMRELHFGKKP